MISSPLLGLIQVSEDTWCQVYAQFYVLYKAGTALEIIAVQDEPPHGKPVQSRKCLQNCRRVMK